MAEPRRPRPRTRTLVAWASSLVVAAAAVGGAIVYPGYDAENLPTTETGVWVSRTDGSGQYARFNTEVGELQVVKDAKGVGGVLQSGASAFVLAKGDGKYWPVDAANPVDLGGDAAAGARQDSGGQQPAADTSTSGEDRSAEGVSAPDGTQDIVTAGDFVLFVGPSPSWARVDELGGEQPRFHALDPYAADPSAAPAGAGQYSAALATVSRDGIVAMLSVDAHERGIRTYDAVRDLWSGLQPIANAPDTTADNLQLTMVGDRWALLRGGDQPHLWTSSGDWDLSQWIADGGARLQAPGPASGAVVIATTNSVEVVGLDDGQRVRHVATASGGNAAQPVAFGDAIAVAWLGDSQGELWTADAASLADSGATIADPVPLEIDGAAFSSLPGQPNPAPVIASNGSRAVLEESATGMLWTIPDGRLVPTAAWTADDPPPQQGETAVDDASQQEPPVAEPDAFGVRAGAIATLPVLYNDHDPNAADVLSIDPASVEGLDPAFGTVSLSADDQSLVVRVAGAATTGSFRYKATDGSADSAATTVTLTVATGNSAPVWCDEIVQPSCLITWPKPQIQPGGTASFDVLRGWVDPEGDPVVIQSAVPADGAPIVALPAADGSLAIGSTDPGGAGGTYAVMVTVVDARGAASEPKELDVTVSASPAFTLRGGIVVGTAGTPAVADVDDYASGGSGAFEIVDVVDMSAKPGVLQATSNQAAGTISLEADQPGEYVVTMTVKDAVTQNQLAKSLRFSVAAAAGSVSIPPLTAFVRAGEDTLVDVLGAVQNTTGKALLVTRATPDTAAVAAAVSDAAAVQLRTTDPALPPGALGTVQVDLADADGDAYHAQIAVFLVAAQTNAHPIAVPDTVTVRAGQVVDLDVLANDVAPYGERLSLHPDVSTAGAPDDLLAFASGDTLRIRAPQAAGDWVIRYNAYLAENPGYLAAGQVAVHVVPAGSNRAPQAVDLTARGLAGRSIAIPLPVDGMDPDGDPVAVTGVTQPADATLGAVQIGADGQSLVYFAPEPDDAGSTGWQAEFEYTVADGAGATSTAAVRVVITTQDVSDEAPLVFSDHQRVEQVPSGGDPVDVAVEPLLNDRDPGASAVAGDAGSGLHILGAVTPDEPGDLGDPGSRAARAAALLVPVEPGPDGEGKGTATAEAYPDGQVRFRVTADTEPGTYLFLYTVESLRTLATAQGLIVITVSAGASPDRPVIEDTVVDASTRDQLADGGIDVLSGKVVWSTGDAAALAATLQLAPGAPAGFGVRGSTGRITGPLPAEGAIVPFQVSGTDRDGKAFTAYGLLRIPPTDGYRLVALRHVTVKERDTQEIDLDQLLGVGPGDHVEVSPELSGFTTHRPTLDPADPTTCALRAGGGAVLDYHASYYPGNASDTCTIVARIAGQSDAAWAAVVIPIDITPIDPLAIVNPTTRTVGISSGAESFDLYRMLVGWTGGLALPDLSTMTFSWTYQGGAFGVSPASGSAHPNADGSDAQLTVKADADAAPGTADQIRVTVHYPYPPHQGTATPPDFDETVTITLIVGMAPSESPSGASLALQCSARDDPSGCDVQAVLPSDAQGQFNAITAANASGEVSLRLVGLGGGTAQAFDCTGIATATIQGDRVRFAWLPADGDKFAGGSCTVPFTVVDRQGRTGQGSIAFAADGYPAKPQPPVTSAYTGDSVTLDVALGAAAQARPALTGVKLLDADTGAAMPGASCAPLGAGTYRCVVGGLQNGQVRHIQAVAVNATGDSLPTSAVTTNAYRAPAFDAGRPAYDDQVYVAGTTTASQGVVAVAACAANGVQRIRFTAGSLTQEVSTNGTNCVPAGTRLTLPVGATTITATPISQFAPPQVGTVAGVSTGAAAAVAVNVRGTASIRTQPAIMVNADVTRLDVAFAVEPNGGDASGPSGDGSRGDPTVHVLAWIAGEPAPTCAAADAETGAGGGLAISGGGASLIDHVLAGGASADSFAIGAGAELRPNETYDVKVCAVYGYRFAQSATASTILFRKPAAPTAADMTYTSAATPSDMDDFLAETGTTLSWTVPDTPPTNNAAADFAAQMAALDAAPGGSAWQVRYATSTNGPFTATAIGDNTSAWYAEFCFTSGGQDYCSAPSAKITSKHGSVGISFGSTGSVTLPTTAQCQAVVDDANAQIEAAGQAAVQQAAEQKAADQAAAAGQAAYDSRYGQLIDTAFTDAANAYVYSTAGGATPAGVDPTVWRWFRGRTVGGTDYSTYTSADGHAYQGFNPTYTAYLAANAVDPAAPTDDEKAAAADAARTAGIVTATAYATDQANAAKQAAIAAAPPASSYTGDADVQAAGAAAEQTRYAALAAAVAAQAPRPQIAGITPSAPFTGPQIAATGDDGSRRYTGIAYTYDGSPATANVAYVLQTIQSRFGTTVSCG